MRGGGRGRLGGGGRGREGRRGVKVGFHVGQFAAIQTYRARERIFHGPVQMFSKALPMIKPSYEIY